MLQAESEQPCPLSRLDCIHTGRPLHANTSRYTHTKKHLCSSSYHQYYLKLFHICPSPPLEHKLQEGGTFTFHCYVAMADTTAWHIGGPQ